MTPSNDHPEIPSLKPASKDDEKKAGGTLPSASKPPSSSGFKFPGFGGSTGSKGSLAANVKVRGLPGGATLMDRLKNLRKKDLIFIAAGLCTLGTAPLAEHLLMSPEDQTAKLKEGFNSQGPLFPGDGSTVYEPGNGVGSPGGLVGQGSDVITPLNVRDPSNLIMSPGAQKKADAVANAAPPPPPSASTGGKDDWKDVLRDSAKSGATRAVSSAPKLPKPNVKMAGAIRGLSALGGGGGGTGASLKLDPLSAQHAPNHAAGSNSLSRTQAAPGFRGVAQRSNASSGAGEALRDAGMKQSDIFNRGGGAAAALDAASREAIPAGGASSGSGGRPGEGGETKSPGGNSQKDNKSLGESLAFLRQKMEQEKSIDLKWKRKEWNEFGRQKMLEESAIKLGFDMFGKFAEKAFIGPLGDFIGQSITPNSTIQKYVCDDGTILPKSQADAQKCSPFGSSRPGTVNLKCDGGAVLKGCILTTGPGADSSAGNRGQYEQSPPRISGPPRERIAEGASTGIRGAFNAHCQKPGGTAPAATGGATAPAPGGDYWGDANCKALDEIAKVGEVDFPAIEKHNDNAIKFLEQGYTKLVNSQGVLEKGSAALGKTIGAASGNAAPPATAPLSVIKTQVDAANTKLTAFKNTDAEKELAKGKTDGLDPAVGKDGKALCTGLAAGAAIADACGGVAPAKQTADGAKDDITNAQAQVKAGYDRAQTALSAINAQKGDASTSGRGVDDMKTELVTRLNKLKELLGKTGGADGTGGYVGSANAVYTKHEAARKAILGDTPTDGGTALTLGVTALNKGEAIVTLPTQPAPSGGQAPWRKPSDYVGVNNAPPAVALPAGVTDPEQAAAQANMATVAPMKGEFDGSITGARQQLQATAQPLKTAKTNVEACSKNFACTVQ